MGEVALAEEPLDIAVGGGADVVGAEGGSLVAVTAGVGFVALGAVVGCRRARRLRSACRLAGEGIGAGVIFGRDVVPVGMDGGGKGQRGAEDEGRKRKEVCGGNASLRTSVGGVEPVADLIEFIGDADAVDAGEAGGGEAEAGREAEAQAFGKLPADERRDVVRCVAEGEGGGVAEAAVGFSAGDELFRAEGAGAAARQRRARGGRRRWRSRTPMVRWPRFFSAMKFSEMFQSLTLEERMSLSSASC